MAKKREVKTKDISKLLALTSKTIDSFGSMPLEELAIRKYAQKVETALKKVHGLNLQGITTTIENEKYAPPFHVSWNLIYKD